MPAALAHLDLAEARGCELGDEGRDEVVGEPVDRRVVGETVVVRPGLGRGSLGHRASVSARSRADSARRATMMLRSSRIRAGMLGRGAGGAGTSTVAIAPRTR